MSHLADFKNKDIREILKEANSMIGENLNDHVSSTIIKGIELAIHELNRMQSSIITFINKEKNEKNNWHKSFEVEVQKNVQSNLEYITENLFPSLHDPQTKGRKFLSGIKNRMRAFDAITQKYGIKIEEAEELIKEINMIRTI